VLSWSDVVFYASNIHFFQLLVYRSKLRYCSIFFISGVGLSPLGTATTSGLLYQPQMIDEGDGGAIGGMKIWQGKPKYSEETYPSATLSTTNPTGPDPGWNPGRRGGKSATNRLSYGAALDIVLLHLLLHTFHLYSYCNSRDQVSRPCKTTDKHIFFVVTRGTAGLTELFRASDIFW
jgi:hypothetical protein